MKLLIGMIQVKYFALPFATYKLASTCTQTCNSDVNLQQRRTTTNDGFGNISCSDDT